ncbi:MAG TPA: aminodeoxychorismate/anthranilate synthase component II [Methanoregulaceae archaeon]|nr:aminodeoxychorismate/anthranilate synthase component II [Methanoregulaceae archaeon]HQJ87111.1 aminodeoxychorismate/anthranilate synthase component II [Methanoregulaceae archaeon]
MRVLVLDAFDSFTHNLCQQLGRLGARVDVITAEGSIDRVISVPCDRIVLSPGPGGPASVPLFREVLEQVSCRVPTLGVCLGHQAIVTTFGGRVVRAPAVVHGKEATVVHDGRGIYAGLPSPITAVRYHSLVADEATLPSELLVTARAVEDGVIMGLRHRLFPIEGVQFHPESYLTRDGDALLRRFLFGGGAAS